MVVYHDVGGLLVPVIKKTHTHTRARARMHAYARVLTYTCNNRTLPGVVWK